MRKMCKSMLAVGLILIMAPVLAACSSKAPAEDEKSENKEEKMKMEAILISSSSQVTTAQGNTMKEYAREQGIDFSVEYYDQNIAAEADLIENAVTSGVDVLIVHNQSEGDCVDVINEAVEKGVTVLLYATDIPDAEYTYLITEDAYLLGKETGKMAGEWANKKLVANGEAVVAAIGTYSVTPIAVDRSNGIKDGLAEVCPEAEIVGTYEMAYKEEGLEVGENILQGHDDVNLVVGINDQSTCGVYEAFKAAGLENNNIGMFGIDGTDEAIYYIANDTMFKGTYYISANDVGIQLVQKGIELMKNGGTEGGEKEVAYWTPEKITADNAEDYKEIWEDLEK